MSLPSTMRASELVRAGEVRVVTRPTPEPSGRQVLVQVASVGVCGSDVHYYVDGRIGDFVVEAPLVLGHEASGVVVARGPDASALEVGQRVAVEPGVPCGRCEACRHGRYNLCPDVVFLATPPVDGAFCEYLAVDEAFAHPVPDSLGDDAAALVEPLAVAMWSLRKAGLVAGERVLVTGAGPVGLLVAQVARAGGAAEVVVTDVSPERLAAAARLGATATVDVRTTRLRDVAGLSPHVLVDCSGNPPAVAEAMTVVAPSGRVVLVGMSADAVTAVPTQTIQNHELTVTGTFRYANVHPAAVALAASGAVDLEALVTGHYGLDGVETALTVGRSDPTSIKPVVRPGG